MSKNVDVIAYAEGIRRRADLAKWLGGEEPYTDEELEIKSRCLGKNAEIHAIKLISAHRKVQAQSLLSGGGDASESEIALVGSIKGGHQEITSRIVVGSVRRGRLARYLGGAADEDLTEK